MAVGETTAAGEDAAEEDGVVPEGAFGVDVGRESGCGAELKSGCVWGVRWRCLRKSVLGGNLLDMVMMIMTWRRSRVRVR